MYLLLALACRMPTNAPESPDTAAIPAPSVVECHPGTATAVEAQGGVFGVSVRLPSGVDVAPMVQVLSGEVIVYCPADGGALTVEWD
jgi:hypothetical protein